MVRTRFAPAATQHLSVRQLQSALFNSLLARSRSGKFVVRFGDADLVRGRNETIHRMLDDIRWLDIEWEEGPDIGGEYGPYLQSECADAYRERIGKLEASGRLYPCFCESAVPAGSSEVDGSSDGVDDPCEMLGTKEILRHRRRNDPCALRFRIDRKRPYRFRDLVRGWVAVPPERVANPFVQRSDGQAAAEFADAVDDVRMRITHLLRPEDEIPFTAAQLAILDELGERAPRIGHHAVLVGCDGKPYSRRHGAFTVESFKKLGYLPATVANYLVHLGWTRRGIGMKFDARELGDRFHLAGMRRTSLPFAFPEINRLSNEYIREENLDHLADRVFPYLIEGRFLDEDCDRDRLKRILETLRSHLHCLAEIVKYVDIFFGETVIEPRGREALREEHAPKVLRTLRDLLVQESEVDASSFRAILDRVEGETGVGGERLLVPVRAALTGMTQESDVEGIAGILGTKGCIEKIDRALLETVSPYA